MSDSAYTTDAVSKQEQIKTAREFNEMTKSKPMKTYQTFDIQDLTIYPAHRQRPM